MDKLISLSNPDSLVLAEKILKDGGVIVFPTETVYALSCDARLEDSVGRIFQIKNRNVNTPFSVFVDHLEAISQYANLNEIEQKIAKNFMPGQITLILKVKEGHNLAKNINLKNDSIGFRIPSNDFALNLLRKSKIPLIGTSANISGDNKAAEDYRNILSTIGDKVDLILYDENFIASPPSTVVGILEGKPVIYREGPISLDQIEKKIFGY